MECEKRIRIQTRFLGIPIKHRVLNEQDELILEKQMATSSPFDLSSHWTVGPKLSLRYKPHWKAIIYELDKSVTRQTDWKQKC